MKQPDKPVRHSTRLLDFDYAQAGAYFITICTQNRQCLFGEIANKEMRLNDAGKIPKPLRINRGLLWRKSDILLWLEYDCPSRRQFEKIRKAVGIHGK